MTSRADKLVIDAHTHGHTDPQTQLMTIYPKAKTGRVKIETASNKETNGFPMSSIVYLMVCNAMMWYTRHYDII